MKAKFRCTNPECAKEDDAGVVMTLEQEYIMDDKNVAQMFCPKCKSRLVRVEDTSQAAS